MNLKSKTIRKRNKVEILDSTLREGEQSRSSFFTIKQKVEIARKLDEFGVDYIELGHPVASKSIRKAIATITDIGLKAATIAHARAKKEDIDAARESGVDWVGIFSGINRYSLKYRNPLSKKKTVNNALDKIRYSKDVGLKVRFTCEDATRTDMDDLIELYGKAVDAGADSISVADTVGIMTPEKTRKLISAVKDAIGADIHVHFHNDFGMATANSLAAFESGAKVIDVTINGIGERCGIAPLAEVSLALTQLYGVKGDWNLKMLPVLSEMISRYTSIPIDSAKPIVGENAFSHKGGIHCAAVLKNPATYEPFSPDIVGRQRSLIVSKLIGENGLRGILNGIMPISDLDFDYVIKKIKNNEDFELISENEIRKAVAKILNEKNRK